MKKIKLLSLLTLLTLSTTAVVSAQNNIPITSGAVAGSGGMSQMGIRDYLLGPGDILDLRVFNETQFDGTLEVSSNGTIIVPFVEVPISAGCRRLEDVRADVVAALGKMLRKPQVNLQIRERRSRVPAVVYGAVQQPQRFEMNRRVKLLELISYTGGFTEKASGTIQITHTQATICAEPEDTVVTTNTNAELPADVAMNIADDATKIPFDVYSIEELRAGKAEANPFVRPGDIVQVVEAQPIYITGAVTAPQGVYWREGMTLTRGLAMVGGVRKDAKTNKIRIIRQKPNTNDKPEYLSVNYKAIRSQKEADVMLKPYDIVEVGEANPFSLDQLPKTLLGFATTGASGFITNAPLRVIY